MTTSVDVAREARVSVSTVSQVVNDARRVVGAGYSPNAVARSLLQRRVDGLILFPSAYPERRTLLQLAEKGTPSVLVDRTPDASFDQVGVDNSDAICGLATQFLIERIAVPRGPPRTARLKTSLVERESCGDVA